MRPRTGRRGFNDRLQEMNEGRREQLERIRRIGGVEEPQSPYSSNWQPLIFDYVRDSPVARENDEQVWDSLRELTRSIGSRRTATAPPSTVEMIEAPLTQHLNRERLSHISRSIYNGLGVPDYMLGMGAQGLTGTSGSMSMEMDSGAFAMLMAGAITLEEYSKMKQMDNIKNKEKITNEEVKFLLETE